MYITVQDLINMELVVEDGRNRVSRVMSKMLGVEEVYTHKLLSTPDTVDYVKDMAQISAYSVILREPLYYIDKKVSWVEWIKDYSKEFFDKYREKGLDMKVQLIGLSPQEFWNIYDNANRIYSKYFDLENKLDNVEVRDRSEFLEVPENYDRIHLPKVKIAMKVAKARVDKGMTIRQLSEKIGIKHPQLSRITSSENYTIDTLLKILDALDLELVVREKLPKPARELEYVE